MNDQPPSAIDVIRTLAREKIEGGQLPDRESHTQWRDDSEHADPCAVCGEDIGPGELCCRLDQDQQLHAKCYSAWWLEVRVLREQRLEIRPLQAGRWFRH